MSGSRTIREACRVLPFLACAVVAPHTSFALDPSRTLSQYVVTRWGPASLPGGVINAIAQTPDGYLWIGTDAGLVRFNGFEFRVFDHAKSRSLPPSPVLDLAVDHEGALWVRMQSPYLMRYRGGKFEQMYPAHVPPEFTFARETGAAGLARGARDGVLIAAPGGALRYTGGTFTPLISSGSVSGNRTSIAETSDGTVWVGTRESGLFCVRQGRASPAGLPDHKVNVLLPDAGTNLWIGTDAGLWHSDGSTVTRQGVPPALRRTPVLALSRDRNSNLWVATPSGITRIDSNGSTVHETGGSGAGVVHAIFEDREGNVWFGGTQGLMQKRDTPFLSYTTAATREGASVSVDASGRAWIAPSSGGLLWIHGTVNHVFNTHGLGRDVVYSIASGTDEVWLGRKLGGVTHLRQHGSVLQARTYTARDGLAAGIIHAVSRGRDGSVWAGTLNGAVSHIENGRITTFTAAHGLSADAVTTIEEGPDGVIWVGTTGGLQALRDGHWRRYGGGDGLPPGRVNTLAFDGDKTLWVGSSSGLFYWTGSRFESARNAPDLLQGEIYGVAADGSGNLWVVTDQHVVSVSRSGLLGNANSLPTMREFGVADGLPSTRGIRRDHSVSKDRLGRIWVSLQGGISVVNPSLASSVAPAIANVESVSVDGVALPTVPIARYPSSSHRVVFNFTGVSLAVPGRVRYRYLLEGYDTDWSQPTESREAAYTRLPPARYTFRVLASNSEGLWNGAAASVPLEVTPQLTETRWFRTAAIAFALAGLFAGLRYRVARVHATIKLRYEERLAERTRIARELHDTLLQSFQGLMLRLQVVDDLLPPGKAKDQLQVSLDRADQAIAEGRSAVKDLRSSTTTTNDLAEAVKAVGDELATQSSAAFHLLVEGPGRDLHPIIRDELYRIAREALRNAFRHSSAHHIEAEIAYGERVLRLRIRDDGEGIPNELVEVGRPGHYGLSGMRERAHQIGAKLDIWTGARAGTEIELSIAGSLAYRTSASRLFAFFRTKAAGEK